MAPDVEMMTVDQVARITRVSPETIYRLARRGELPGRKIGRIWRFPREAILEYLNHGTAAGTAGLASENEL